MAGKNGGVRPGAGAPPNIEKYLGLLERTIARQRERQTRRPDTALSLGQAENIFRRIDALSQECEVFIVEAPEYPKDEEESP